MDPELCRRLGDDLDLEPNVRGDTSGERAVLAARATEGALRLEPGASRVADWSPRALERGPLDDSVSSSGIWVNAAMPLSFAGDFATATSVADTMVTDARRRGAPVAAARAHMVRACANLHRGSIADAEADARASCELGLDIGFPPSRLAVGVLVEALVEGEQRPTMPAKTKTESDGFSAEERAAMKQRAAELRAEGKTGAKKADALQAALDSIAAMAPDDRALAKRVHATVTSTAPELSPKTWYGMPADANEDGKVVVFFKDAGKFKSRYATLGFEEAANLDDGPMWPTSCALTEWTSAVEKKVVALVKAAAS